MRQTRFLMVAALFLATLTAAGAQTNSPDLRRGALERSAVQDELVSQQELRERAQALQQEEGAPVTTGSIRVPTTSGSGQRTVTGPTKRKVIE